MDGFMRGHHLLQWCFDFLSIPFSSIMCSFSCVPTFWGCCAKKHDWTNATKSMISCWVLGKVQIHQSWISLCHGRFLPRTESKREELQCRRGRIRCVFVYQIVRPFPKNTYAIAFGWGVENQLKHIPKSLLSGPMTAFVGGKCIHVTNRPKENRGSKCGNHKS